MKQKIILRITAIICFIMIGLSQIQIDKETIIIKTEVTEKSIQMELVETLKEDLELPEPELEIEESNIEEMRTSTAYYETEPKIVYKSIDEVEISRDMDLTETTGLSKENFYELLANFKYDYDGFYERNADFIWELSQKYKVNEIFICGVFALESLYGSDEEHIRTHNYGSIMKNEKLVKYDSDPEGIEANFRLLANSYLTPEGKHYKGVTLDAIGDTYCPPTAKCPSWSSKVYSCMRKFLEK